MLEGQEHYAGREQSWVKHYVLRKYLERFAPIIGFGCPSITYVDGFSGPWSLQSENLADSSFSIALTELRKARETHARSGRALRLRCVFLEQDRSRFTVLQKFANGITDAEVLPLNSSFEDAIPEVIRFLEKDRESFPFIFIDPTGWTGFSMESIAPLLERDPCEVLINFMLEFIRRFIDHDFSRESFRKLFGSDDFDSGLKDLQGMDRDDAIANRYCQSLREVCNFDFVQRAIVLHPDKDKTHFLLVHGSRHVKGVEVFKDAEKHAMTAQETSRAQVEVRKKQQPLLDPEEMPESKYYIDLRNRYLSFARNDVVQRVNTSSRVSYDELWKMALAYPLVWESDLRDWLNEWRKADLIVYFGMGQRERALKKGKQHVVSRTADRVF